MSSAADDIQRKYLFVMGGGGDPQGPSTMFDNAVIELGKKAKEGAWQSEIIYDGGHASSEMNVEKIYGKSQNFDPRTMNIMMEKIESRINDSDPNTGFRAGDKVMFWIDTHGKIKMPYEKGHSLMCGAAGTYESCSTDKIFDLINKLEAKGVKVALVDASCYSGNSLNFATDKTCVVTAARRDTVGYDTFINAFPSHLKPGVSLEATFLPIRNTDYGHPQISSPAGLKIEKLLDSLFGNKIIAEHGVSNLLDGDLCVDQRFAQMQAEIEQISGLQSAIIKNILAPLKAADMKYANLIAEAKETKQKIEKLNRKLSGSCPDFASASESPQSLKVLKLQSSESENSHYFDKDIAAVEKCVAARNELLQNHDAQFLEYEDLNRKFSELTREDRQVNTWFFGGQTDRSPILKAADNVFAEERKVYDSLYKAFSEQSQEPNPCKDFTF